MFSVQVVVDRISGLAHSGLGICVSALQVVGKFQDF